MNLSARLRLTLLILPLLLILAHPGCGRGRKKVIGMIPMGQAHLYWQSVHAGAVAAAREQDVEIYWNGPALETDITSQIQIMETMVNRRLDGIAIAPIDKQALVGVVEKAYQQQIPVIIFDSPLDSNHFVSQVATDNYHAGCLAAERMGEILKGKGEVAVVASHPGSSSSVAREQGFDDTIIKKFPDVKIVDKRFGMSDFAKSLAVAENILTAHPDLDGIFASNEPGSVGVTQALAARKNTKTRFVGFDWSPQLLAALRSGEIDSLVVQNPFKMGYESVLAAVKSIRGEVPPKINSLAARLITKENVDDPDVQKQLNPDLKKYLQ